MISQDTGIEVGPNRRTSLQLILPFHSGLYVLSVFPFRVSCIRHVYSIRMEHALRLGGLGQMKVSILQSANGHLLVYLVIISDTRVPDDHLLLRCVGAGIEKR